MPSASQYFPAYEWYEKSYGHGWSINPSSQIDLIIAMKRAASRLEDKTLINKTSFYLRQYELNQILTWFSDSVVDQSLALHLLSNPVSLREKMFLANPDRVFVFSKKAIHPVEFIEQFRKWSSENLDFTKGALNVKDSSIWPSGGMETIKVQKTILVHEWHSLKISLQFDQEINKWIMGVKYNPIDNSWLIQSIGLAIN